MTRPHLACWDSREETYHHICQQPSGLICREGCGREAGTWWTSHWCPECDVKRMIKIDQQLRALIEPGKNNPRP